MQCKKYLDEVTPVRLLLIVLLVMYHSFAPFNRQWPAFAGQESVEGIYGMISRTSYSFMLEAFVFISGYIFGNQLLNNISGGVKLRPIVLKKFKRLIVPSIVFSVLYTLIYHPADFKQPATALCIIINGDNHMWFLPMLFWCFVVVAIMERYGTSSARWFPLFLGLALVHWPGNPLELGAACYYFPFFYVGVYLKRNVELDRFVNWRNLTIAAIGYLVSFSVTHYVSYAYFPPLEERTQWQFMVINFGKIIYAACGVAVVMMLALMLVRRPGFVLPVWMKTMASYCFGVYIYQQFILWGLYYRTDVPQYVPIGWLPWVAFVGALLFSLVLTRLTLSFNVGRKLLG